MVETAYATLLAIYVLAEAFDDKEDEWLLLVRKAKHIRSSCQDIP